MKIKVVMMMMAMSSMAMGAQAQSQLKSGIDLTDLNQQVRPGEDFYDYACGGWMQKNPWHLLWVLSRKWKQPRRWLSSSPFSWR